MKGIITVLISALLCLSTSSLFAESKPILQSVNIHENSLDLRGGPVVIEQINFDAPQDGKVLLQFNGQCVSHAGDRIVLAASNTTNWSPNDGNVNFEAYDNDININSFSHTRIYDVTNGNHTFYAVGQNYVEMDGPGTAAVYGTFTLKFFPNTSSSIVHSVISTGISVGPLDLNGTPPFLLGSVILDAPTLGRAVVRFDGICQATAGDRIGLGVSDDLNLGVNDDIATAEPIDSDVNIRTVSHTRSYEVTAGMHTFNALAAYGVETGGNGIVYVTGSLTVEFYPYLMDINENWPVAFHEGINETNVDVSGDVVPLKQITLNAQESGKVLVTFDGTLVSSEGDLIVCAASNTIGWLANDGNVSLEAFDNDINGNAISHSRVYDVNAGSNTFYAVAQNHVELGGTGIASFYGSLTAFFFPDDTEIEVGVSELILIDNDLIVYPSPTDGIVNIRYSRNDHELFETNIIAISGKTVRSFGTLSTNDLQSLDIDLSNLDSGMYFFRMINETKVGTAEIIIQ